MFIDEYIILDEPHAFLNSFVNIASPTLHRRWFLGTKFILLTILVL